jgi:uncharacterized protein YukE
MDGIKIDVDWVRGYAKQLDTAEAEVGKVHDALHNQPLTADAFGELGRTVGSAEAYSSAAQMLTEQVERASQMLTSASQGLVATANEFHGHDEDAVGHIKRADHR